MPTLDADSLLSDPAPLWFDHASLRLEPGADAPDDTQPAGLAGPSLADQHLQAALASLAATTAGHPVGRLVGSLVGQPGGRPALAVVPPPAADPLAQALPWLVRHLGVAAAVEAAVGPVHEDRPLPSDDVLPALRRIGFEAHLQRRTLASFAKADLPAVLLLHSGDSCVLTARWQDAQGQAQCSVVLPGPQPDEFSSAEAEIDAEYSGVALVVSAPRPPFASALARARAASASASASASAIAPASAAALPGTLPQADALVALAAAVQGAQRLRGVASAAGDDGVHSEQSAGGSLARPAASAPQWLGQPGRPGQRVEPMLGDPAAPGQAGVADDPAAPLNLRFMQGDRRMVRPGLAIQRIGQAGRGLLRLAVWAGRGVGRCGRALQRAGLWAGPWASQALATARRCGGRLARPALWSLLLRPWQRLLQARRLRQARVALAGKNLPLPVGQPAPAAAVLARRVAASGLLRAIPAACGRAWTLLAQPLAGLPGLAAGSVLCLWVGAPQAWAGMVSGSSLQALRVAPSLLRSAFRADLDQAALALADQVLADQALATLQAAKQYQDCQAGQPGVSQALPAEPGLVTTGLPLRVARPAAAERGRCAARLGPQAPPMLAARPAHRGRSGPRRARHACR